MACSQAIPLAQSGLDFDGDYGRAYRQRIRSAIPGYNVMLEIATAALAPVTGPADAGDAVLVVGPGPGEELDLLLAALPAARFTAATAADAAAQLQRGSTWPGL